MITYQTELLHCVIEELKPLIECHQEEVDLFRGKVLLNPAYEKYVAMSKMDMLHLSTVRDGDTLIGYYLSVIQPHLHYSDVLYAINDILYLDPSYRHREIAEGLLEYVEDEYRSLGVTVMTLNMKYNVRFESLMEKRGLEKKEELYMKYLGD